MNEQIIPGHKRLDKHDFIWLFYLVFFLIEPITSHSARLWIDSGLFIAVFLALFFAFMLYGRTAARLLCLALMFVLGLIAFPINAASTCFMIYSAALLPFTLSSLRWIVTGLLAETAIFALEAWYLHANPFNWFIGSILIFGVGGGNILFAQRQRADRKLRRKQEEIEALAAVAERERIARDLHDVLGHTLSVIVLKSELAGRLLDLDLTPLASNPAPAHTDASSQSLSSRPDAPSQLLSSRPDASSQSPSSRPDAPSQSLSSRPERSEVERPAVAPAHAETHLDASTQSLSSRLDASSQSPSSRPERSEVERPAVAPAHADTHLDASTQSLSSRLDASSQSLSSRLDASSQSLSSRPERSEVERPAVAPAHADTHLDASTLRRARAEIADVERTARTALAEVREAIGGYRARGLAAEIEAAHQILASAGVSLTTEGDLDPASLTAAEETVLALALREAITNIVRHSEATTCRLRMVAEHGHHRLSIQDNGHHAAAREGNGLRGMRERVESLGGQLSLTRDAGTSLIIELPLRTAACR